MLKFGLSGEETMSSTISEISKLWNRILEGIKNRISDRHTYDYFFSDSYIHSIDGDTIVVVLNSTLAVSIIPTKYDSLIVDVINEVTETNFKVKYISQSEAKQNQKSITTFEQPGFFPNAFINPKLTFDTFVIGSCNREASQAALMISSNLGKLYNPLFIYSQSGLGKTHLLHAMGNHIKDNSSRSKVLYISADDFIDEFVRSVRGNNELEKLRDFFKFVDVLLIDDIQFLAEKTKTAEMFFNIFNAMINSGKQVVLTSDRHPNDLKGLEARLVTRFAAGLSININNPDTDTLFAILKKKIIANGLEIDMFDEDVLDFFAKKFSKNVRELEGALNRLVFYSINIKQSKHIDMALALESVQSIIDVKEIEQKLNEERIVDVVADYYNLTPQQIKGKIRTSQISLARHISMYLIRTLLDVPFLKIGQIFGGKDHSTVINAVTKVEKSLKTDPLFVTAISELKKHLHA